jgi:hypothetical protein
MDNWKNITNSQNSARKKSFGGTVSFSNCHIIGLDDGSLVLIVFGYCDNLLSSHVINNTSKIPATKLLFDLLAENKH